MKDLRVDLAGVRDLAAASPNGFVSLDAAAAEFGVTPRYLARSVPEWLSLAGNLRVMRRSFGRRVIVTGFRTVAPHDEVATGVRAPTPCLDDLIRQILALEAERDELLARLAATSSPSPSAPDRREES